mmetsp:Transcript_49344/g.129784  ORF Transcript_49344/g.129784 Transcript_49344/m.129784 type:complete len:200 (-) Transcript_49344:121-720(-)
MLCEQRGPRLNRHDARLVLWPRLARIVAAAIVDDDGREAGASRALPKPLLPLAKAEPHVTGRVCLTAELLAVLRGSVETIERVAKLLGGCEVGCRHHVGLKPSPCQRQQLLHVRTQEDTLRVPLQVVKIEEVTPAGDAINEPCRIGSFRLVHSQVIVRPHPRLHIDGGGLLVRAHMPSVLLSLIALDELPVHHHLRHSP